MTIVQYIAATFWGGGEQYVFDLASALTQQGHRLVFVLQPQSDSMLKERFSSLGTTYTLYPKTKNGKFSFICAGQLAQILRKERASVLHVHELKDLFIGVWAKLFLWGNINLIANHHLVSAGKNKISWRWAYQHVNHYIFVSEAAKNAFLSPKPLARACKTAIVVRNSVPVHSMEESSFSLREQLRIPATDTVFLYHGRICKEKGIIQLLTHLDKQTNLPFHILLAGNIANEDTREWQIAMQDEFIKKHVSYLGFRTDIAALIHQTDCGLLPSIAPESGGPLSLLEHMALASPVIASNNGSQPEFVCDKEDGLLCTPTNYEQWNEAIRWMIHHPQERTQMGQHAQAHFNQSLNYNLFTSKILTLYATK